MKRSSENPMNFMAEALSARERFKAEVRREEAERATEEEKKRAKAVSDLVEAVTAAIGSDMFESLPLEKHGYFDEDGLPSIRYNVKGGGFALYPMTNRHPEPGDDSAYFRLNFPKPLRTRFGSDSSIAVGSSDLKEAILLSAGIYFGGDIRND